MAGLWDPHPNPTLCRTTSSSSTSSFGGYFMDHHNNQSCYNYVMMEKMEKRQLFLRSYQFCRKKSLTEKIKGSLVKVKRVIYLRLRNAKKLRKSVCFRLRCGFSFRRRRLCRLLNYYRHNKKCDNSYCFWLPLYCGLGSFDLPNMKKRLNQCVSICLESVIRNQPSASSCHPRALASGGPASGSSASGGRICSRPTCGTSWCYTRIWFPIGPSISG